MAGNRSFSDDNLPMMADDYHGLAGYVRTQPDVAAQGVKSINNFDPDSPSRRDFAFSAAL